MNTQLRLSTPPVVRVAGILLAAAFLPVALPAQNPGASANSGDNIIRSETRFVLVDAVPLDKKNNFPRDLTQKDFRIWEDGREQKITSFSLESAGVSPERSNKHYFVLFFDTYSSSQPRVRQETIQFVDSFASPDRYMAIVNSYGAGLQTAQNFTADPERLKAALNALQQGGSRSTTPAPAAGGGRGRGMATTAVTGDILSYRDMLTSLGSVANSLAAIRGRKALILYSFGFTMTSEINDSVQAAIDACNKANVAVYSVLLGTTFGGGLGGMSDASPSGSQYSRRPTSAMDQSSPNQNALATLADRTGGFTFLTNNDLVNGLGNIAREQDSYYLLGYTPAVESAEGTCHALKVKVDRSGLDVRAREGYCTSTVGLLSTKPAGNDLESRAASGTGGNIPAKMQLPWFYSGPNAAQVSLAMDIVPSTMKLQKIKGKLHGEFDLTGIAYKPDGSVAGRFSDTVKLDFESQQQADAFLKTPYHYVNQFQIAPGQYNFRLAFSSGDQGFGKVDMPLNIQPWNGQVLSMSGIAMSHDAHPYTGLVAGLDDSLLEGPRPLVARGTEIVPTGTNQFRAADRCILYFEVYDPRVASVPGASPDTALPAVSVRVRVLDRASGQPKNDSGPMSASNFMRPGNPVIPIAMPAKIAGLPAGAYKMEVSVMRDSGDPVVRTTDFDVN